MSFFAGADKVIMGKVHHLRKIAEVIGCDPDDLLARAGRVPSELSEIIKQSPHRHEMTALLRTAKGFTAEEMEKLVRQAQKIKEK